MYNLGMCLQQGRGVPADLSAARQLYARAAAAGHRQAQRCGAALAAWAALAAPLAAVPRDGPQARGSLRRWHQRMLAPALLAVKLPIKLPAQDAKPRCA
jgi:TPR repeat protein